MQPHTFIKQLAARVTGEGQRPACVAIWHGLLRLLLTDLALGGRKSWLGGDVGLGLNLLGIAAEPAGSGSSCSARAFWTRKKAGGRFTEGASARAAVAASQPAMPQPVGVSLELCVSLEYLLPGRVPACLWTGLCPRLWISDASSGQVASNDPQTVDSLDDYLRQR